MGSREVAADSPDASRDEPKSRWDPEASSQIPGSSGGFPAFSGPRVAVRGRRDPKRLLWGSGKQTRFIQVEAASELAHPDVEALIAATIDQARVPLPSKGKGRLIIMSDGAKKPPRQKPSK
jgi:hypothetical protein